jgi:hypothetical protein
MNLIYDEKEFNVKRFYLTKQGKDTLSVFLSRVSHIKTKELPLRSHRLLWISKIINTPKYIKKKLLQSSWIESPMVNWSRYIKNFEDFKIVWCPNVIQFYIKPFYTTSKEDYYAKSLEIIEEAINYLQSKYKGLVLGTPEETSVLKKQELAREFEPLALFFLRTMEKTGRKITFRGKNIDIDFSKGNPETDYKDTTKAPQQAMNMAEFFDSLVEKSLQEIQGILNVPNTIKDIVECTKRNALAITEILNTQKNQMQVNNQIMAKQDQILYHIQAIRDLNPKFDKPEYIG